MKKTLARILSDILYSEYRKQSNAMKKPMNRKKLEFIGFYYTSSNIKSGEDHYLFDESIIRSEKMFAHE